jgi:hypothetical protein
MKSYIYEDGSSAMVFTQAELSLHQVLLTKIRFTDPRAIKEQSDMLVLLEMAKHYTGDESDSKH